MRKGIIFLLSIISTFFLRCGGTGSEIQEQSMPLSLETLPAAIDLKTEDLIIEDITLEMLNDSSNGEIEIIYHPKTGIPRQINGFFTMRKISSEQDAFKLLLSTRTIFQIPDDCSFTCLDFDDERIDLQVYTLNQLYKGVLVDGGQFSIATTKDGIPVSVSGVYLQAVEVDENPALTAEECLKAIPSNSSSSISSVSLVVRLTQNNESHLCWKYKMFSVVYYVDAHNGELLDTISTVIY